MKEPTVAVIDLGSNSIKLLVAKADPYSKIKPLLYKSEDTRIAQGTGQLALTDEAIAAAAQSVHKLYQAALDGYQPSRVEIVGTSAVREANNNHILSEKIYALTGLSLRVLSGEEEALAIAQGVQLDPQLQDLSAFNLFDLGGGSLELIHFEAGRVEQALSLPLGAVRLTEDLVSYASEALSSQEADAIADRVKNSIKNSGFKYFREEFFKNQRPLPLIGTGGAMTILKNLFDNNTPFIRPLGEPRILVSGRGQINEEPACLPELVERREECTQAYMRIPSLFLTNLRHKRQWLCKRSIKKNALYDLFIKVARADLQGRIQIHKIPAKRADIFPTALAIILTLLQMSEQDSIRHSYYSLRFGLAYELLKALD